MVSNRRSTVYEDYDGIMQTTCWYILRPHHGFGTFHECEATMGELNEHDPDDSEGIEEILTRGLISW